MLAPGVAAPSFTLRDIATDEPVTDPWRDGRIVLVFFKVTCPVCKMVAPILTKMAEGGVRLIAVGQDPPETIAAFGRSEGQDVYTLTEPPPYDVSASFGLEAVPSIFLIGEDGEIQQAIPGWNRDTWNALAAAAGMSEPISTPDDGLRPFRPG